MTRLFQIGLTAALILMAEPVSAKIIACDDPAIGLSPYTWKQTGSGPNARAEAMLPGAYFRTRVQGAASVALLVDATANAGCPDHAMPILSWSIDDQPTQTMQLTGNDLHSVALAQNLDPKSPHKIELYLRAADLIRDRWNKSTTHLRIAGINIDDGGTVIPEPRRTHLAIGFGDSIVEGVGTESHFDTWDDLHPNCSAATWFPIVARALDCEYGQLGSGGQGMVNDRMQMPPLPQTWDRFDAQTSRLTNGKLAPEPDYIFNADGINDFDADLTHAYEAWLTDVRSKCPNSLIFFVTPVNGSHSQQMKAALATRAAAGEHRAFLIDLAAFNAALPAKGKPTRLAYDGVHPTREGHAELAATIAAAAARRIAEQTPATQPAPATR